MSSNEKKFSMADFKPGYKSWIFSIVMLSIGGVVVKYFLDKADQTPASFELTNHGTQTFKNSKDKYFGVTVLNSGSEDGMIKVIKINGKDHKSFYSNNTTVAESLRNFQFEKSLGGFCPSKKYCEFYIPYKELKSGSKIESISFYIKNEWVAQKI
jgi:hypothetical protein